MPSPYLWVNQLFAVTVLIYIRAADTVADKPGVSELVANAPRRKTVKQGTTR